MTRKEVYVESYVRSDGTEVSAHYRSAPGGGSIVSGKGIMEEPRTNPFEQEEKYPVFDEQPYPPPVMHIEDEEGYIPEDILDSIFSGATEEQVTAKEERPEESSESEIYAYPSGSDSESNTETDEPIYIGEDGVLRGYARHDEMPEVKNSEQIKTNETSEMSTDVKLDVAKIEQAVKQIRMELPETERYATQQKRIKTAISNIERSYQKSLDLETELLDDMINTTDQTKYLKLYEKLTKQQAVNKQNAQTVQKLKYSFQNQRYEDIVNTLNDYKSNYGEVVAKNHMQRPLKVNPDIYSANPIKYQSINNTLDTYINQSPYRAKQIVDAGMWGYNKFKYNNQTYDAKEMWKAASYDFGQSGGYVKKNGSLAYSVRDLPSEELQDIVRTKIKKSGMSDSIGIIYRSDSNMSEQIAKDNAIKEKIQKHKDDLQNGQVVKGESAYFGTNPNLKLSLGHVDIPYMFIDKDGDIKALILDVYDFERDDPDWKVKVAAMAQYGGYIRKYYSLHVIKVPKTEWQELLLKNK